MHALWMLMATFAACCITTSTANTPNMIQLGGTVSKEISGNRFLRDDKETSKDEDEAATDDEERSVNKLRGALGLYNPKLKTSTFDRMIADDVFKAEVFAKWDKFDVSFKKIKESINPVLNTRFQAMLDEYTVRRLLKKRKITPDGLIAELKGSLGYIFADAAGKKKMEDDMIKLINAARRNI
ncbi:hypothetical protein PHYBOEH_009590 [Phytophthora boehmeriae]|uniref:RxLR effector protein n=1 Tax=Phytophthora boehmeriae TaxID=109152 RepID=A0A8T1VW26_9STRA|nr:hypothetical protein PHYBOEH_009590 [Phytophthora boehmeriae]